MKTYRKIKLIILVFVFALSGGCSAMKKTAIKGVSPVLDDVNGAIFHQTDVELVKDGLPANIILVEGMVRSSPNDLNMLVMAAKAYAGLAIIIEDEDPERASALYLQGRDYGMRALNLHRGFRDALSRGEPIEEAVKLVDSKKYLPALLWTGLCWGMEIMVNIGDPGVVVDATKARAIMKQALAMDDTYFYGMAHIFFGSYYAILPSIFGGGPEVVQAEFKKAFEISNGKFLLAKVFYARYYATLVVDEGLYERTLKEVLDAPPDTLPDANLLNQIAKIKAKRLLNEKDKYF